MKKNYPSIINSRHDKTITIHENLYYLTAWFTADTSPARTGTYQVLDNTFMNVYFAHWNGKCWSYKDNGIDWAYHPNIIGQSELKNPSWRGIVKEELNVSVDLDIIAKKEVESN